MYQQAKQQRQIAPKLAIALAFQSAFAFSIFLELATPVIASTPKEVAPIKSESKAPQASTRPSYVYSQNAEQAVIHNNIGEAIRLATQALQADPFNARAYFIRGKAHSLYDDPKNAIKDFDMGMKLDPKAADSFDFDWCSKSLWTLKQSKASMDILNKGIQLKPTAFLYGDRANQRRLEKDDAGALDDMNKAIKLDPTARTVYLERARVYREKHQYEKAIPDYSEVAKLSKKDGEDAIYTYALRERAECYDKVGKSDLAGKDRKVLDSFGKGWAEDMFR
jgi:tetratricopeptide (TPR) repeat protein